MCWTDSSGSQSLKVLFKNRKKAKKIFPDTVRERERARTRGRRTKARELSLLIVGHRLVNQRERELWLRSARERGETELAWQSATNRWILFLSATSRCIFFRIGEYFLPQNRTFGSIKVTFSFCKNSPLFYKDYDFYPAVSKGHAACVPPCPKFKNLKKKYWTLSSRVQSCVCACQSCVRAS